MYTWSCKTNLPTNILCSLTSFSLGTKEGCLYATLDGFTLKGNWVENSEIPPFFAAHNNKTKCNIILYLHSQSIHAASFIILLFFTHCRPVDFNPTNIIGEQYAQIALLSSSLHALQTTEDNHF